MSSAASPGESPARRPRRWLVPVALLALVAVALVGWFVLRPKPSESMKPDLVAAAHANARGIGYMEQFDYRQAIAAFEEASKLAPDWTPARINLGIALLNTQAPENLDRALDIFRDILKANPDDPNALFCTGIINYYRGNLKEAGLHFEALTSRVDPNDAHSWLWQARSVPDASEVMQGKLLFEKALKLNPSLNSARYSLALHALADSDERKRFLLDEYLEFKRLNAEDLFDLKYTEMGRYGEVIGKSPTTALAPGVLPMFESQTLSIKLADGTTWVKPNELDALRNAIRTRFGGALVVFDYNRDGKPDVLLLGAVTRAGDGGEVRDLLLRNDGDGALTDVTKEAGLATHTGSFGAAVGDFDNDGFPDLALTGPAGVRLFRNASGKAFEDKTATAGFEKESGVFLGVAWVDLDQDGDLDLVAAKFARTPELALRQLKGEKVESDGGLVAFANVGIAPPANPGDEVPPLTCAFQPMTAAGLLVKGLVTGVVVTDVDGDLDLDLLVLIDGQPPVTVFNDRLLRFHTGEAVTPTAGKWVGGLVLDANGDDQPDLALLDPAVPPRLLVSKRDKPGSDVGSRFGAGITDSPALRSAAWVDFDLDGHTDLVGTSADRKVVFLQGDGHGKFSRKSEAFGPTAEAIGDVLAASPVDLDGDGKPDLLVWSEASGLRAFRSLGNGNHGLTLTLSGKRKPLIGGEEGKPLRTNADGVGSWVRVHAGPLRTATEATTLFAGLGQSRPPLHFGLGKFDVAEAVRVRWPDGVIQAELNQAAGPVAIVELDRKPSSCPVLFTWDGTRFAYVTDFLGAGAVGESGPDGSVRPPRPEESVKIEPGGLVAKAGKFVLKVAEPMDEIMYLDQLRLDVIDHPADISVYPDERFATTGAQPTQERLFFRDSERVFAAKATTHRGRDVTALLRDRDGKHVEGFALRSWLGYAEDHSVELDFNGELKKLPAGRKVYLVLTGWIDYPFPEAIYASTQAGIPTTAPQLEQKQADGTWKTLGELGFPAGLTRTMTADVTGWIDPKGGPVRIRSNLQIYWDQVFVAPLIEKPEFAVRETPVTRASLEHRGFVQEFRPGGKFPIAYDYDRLEPVAVTHWKGRFTRTGDVTELLTATDDRHVICGPGDEVTAEFAAGPPPPRDWKRSFVLRTWGYCKDMAPTTLTSGMVSPLPHRGMPHYPYDPAKNPVTLTLTEYDRVWNTRPAGRR